MMNLIAVWKNKMIDFHKESTEGKCSSHLLISSEDFRFSSLVFGLLVFL